MVTGRPKVSVIVPLYNAEKTLARCLDSILAQQRDFPIEIIVGDDGSSDMSRQLLSQYTEKYPEIIRPFFNESNFGSVNNYYYLIENAEADYLAFCDHDDFWHDPLKLKKQVEILDANPDAVMTYGDYDLLEESSGRLKAGYRQREGENPPSGMIYEELMRKNYVGAVAVCCRADVTKDVIREHEMMNRPEWTTYDYPLWLALALKGNILYLPESLGTYWKRTSSVSQDQSKSKQLTFEYGIWNIRAYFMRQQAVASELGNTLLKKGGETTVRYLFFNKKDQELHEFSEAKTLPVRTLRARMIMKASFSRRLLDLMRRF